MQLHFKSTLIFFFSSVVIDLFKFNKLFIKYKGNIFFPALLINVFLFTIIIFKYSNKLLNISSKTTFFNLLLLSFPLSLQLIIN